MPCSVKPLGSLRTPEVQFLEILAFTVLDLLVDAVHVQDIRLHIGIFQLVEECRIQTDDGFFPIESVFHSITGQFELLYFLDRNRVVFVVLIRQTLLLDVVVEAADEFDQLHIL